MENSAELGVAIGVARAGDAARKAGDEWAAIAYAAFVEHAKTHLTFHTEDVYLAEENFPEPPDRRAWGSIPRRAVREGIVEFNGWGRSPSAYKHGALLSVWRSKIYDSLD